MHLLHVLPLVILVSFGSQSMVFLFIAFFPFQLELTFCCLLQVPPFQEKHGLWPCMVAPTKIIAGLGLSLGIDILEAPGATGDYRTLLTSKAIVIAKALSAQLQSCPSVFVPGQDEHKPGRTDGYDFGFLHIKVMSLISMFSSELYVLLKGQFLNDYF